MQKTRVIAVEPFAQITQSFSRSRITFKTLGLINTSDRSGLSCFKQKTEKIR